MTTEQWRKIAELYDLARERDSSDRPSFLRDACGGDETILREVESLLQQDPSCDGLLERVSDFARLPESRNPRPPETIGRYRILGVIGEGGMGTVYEAEQEHPRRTVALKVVRLGISGTELRQRFHIESQALGRLQHPGIAQIYEAGAADTGFGLQPFFAMELIRGKPLLEYAKAQKLTVRERLIMLAQVCDAVQHAHGRGIIHRDLKPGNILVDERGVPKILDFGVARIIDADASDNGRTIVGELVGTLAYMSPEQVLADPLEVDARSDVYTLGILLYELLAGRLPYDVGRSVTEAARIIRDQEPFALSNVSKQYRGDLETIVRKALAKDKNQRYASAADFAADIRRYLASEPIQARVPSASYQMRKLISRHKAMFGMIVLLFSILLTGIAFTSYEALRANRAEKSALTERDRAAAAERQANIERDRALNAEAAATSEQGKAQEERNRALDQSRRADAAAATSSAITDFLQNDLLSQASSRAQAGPNSKPDPNLSVRTAVDRAAERIAGKFDAHPEVEAAIRQTIGSTYSDLSLFAEAETQMEKALEMRRRVLGPLHPDTLSTMQSLGTLYVFRGKYDAAESILTKVWEARRRTGGNEEQATLGALNELASAVAAKGDYERATPIYEKIVDGERKLLGEENPDTLSVMNNLAVEYQNLGKYSRAEPIYLRLVDIKRRVLGAQHPSTLLSMNNLAVLYRQEGKYAQAEPLLTAVLDARRTTEGEQHLDTFASMNSLALLYQAEKKFDEAESILIKAFDGMRQLAGEENPNTLRFMSNLGEVRWHEGKLQDAEVMLSRALELRRHLLGPAHPNTTSSLGLLGEFNLEQHRYTGAESFLREALGNYEKTSPDNWRRFQVQSLLGATLAGMSHLEDAEPLLLSGYEGLTRQKSTIPFENQAEITRARERIVQLYRMWNKPEQAAKWQ